MTQRHILTLAFGAALLAAPARTVLLDEDFNDRYDKSFPWMYDADRQTPHHSIASIFYSQTADSTMPWWVAKDTKESQDLYMASHSYYESPATSNDWLISIPLDIPTEGFVLELDAQSVLVRGDEYLSDLALFVTPTLLDVTNIPDTPTHVWTDVPCGDDADNCEGDWTRLSYPLDQYAGQTIYINLVNINTDRDILCIDNVSVWRDDAATLTLNDFESYILEQNTTLSATLDVAAPGGIGPWTVTLTVGSEQLQQWSGDSADAGDKLVFTADCELEPGATTDIHWTLTVDGKLCYTVDSPLTQMTFRPVHRVLFEETTSLHCGNCPAGMHTVESMLSDPDMAESVLPVSVHIASMGADPMATERYYPYLPVSNAAPLIFIERATEYVGLTPAYDLIYDPSNPNSFAHRIATIADTWAPLDISLKLEPVTNGNDTTAIKCTATVTAPCDISGSDYRVAFILTENNVGLDRNPYWIQSNYLAGLDIEGDAGGWAKLPDNVINARYHDVARATSAYNGHYGSVPTDLTHDTPYEYTAQLGIPDTRLEQGGMLLSESVRPYQCEVTAIVIDNATGRAVNGVRVPLDENAPPRFTAADLVQQMGVTDIQAPDDGTVTLYDLTGRRVSNPRPGVYIQHSAAGAVKIIK